MKHEEQRVWLIQQLLGEHSYYRNYEVPANEQEQKDMLRSLMNVREPKIIDDSFLKIQDEYLTEENNSVGITEVNQLPSIHQDSRIILWQGDITALRVDAIVNAANSQMCGCFHPLHNCVDNIIHSKSGIQLRLKCAELMQKQGHEEPTGCAKITPAYNLPCKYVIHTVGPIVQGSLTREDEEQLKSCYRSCLQLAEENGVESIAFCCISTGVFMFPNERAAEIAIETVKGYLKEHNDIKKVIFNVFKDMDFEIYRNLLK